MPEHPVLSPFCGASDGDLWLPVLSVAGKHGFAGCASGPRWNSAAIADLAAASAAASPTGRLQPAPHLPRRTVGESRWSIICLGKQVWPLLGLPGGTEWAEGQGPGEVCWPCSHRTLVLHEASPSRWLLLRQHHRKAAVCEPPTCWHSGLLGGAGA